MAVATFKRDTLRYLRREHSEVMAAYLDEEIAKAYSIYSETFHGGAWVEGDEQHMIQFVNWATKPPIDEINGL